MPALVDKLGSLLRYKDVAWLMPAIDVPTVLQRLGCTFVKVEGDEVRTYCPDHHLFLGRQSSHPKWICNQSTGETYCRTEGRGSTILATTMRLLNLGPEETIAWMTGNNERSVAEWRLLGLQNQLTAKRRQADNGNMTVTVRFAFTEEDFRTGTMLPSGYTFFMRPPGKKPTNIHRATVDKFGVIQRTYGYYSNRVIIPVKQKGELRGFSAIDIMGQEQWLLNHPESTGDDYRKCLFAPGMKTEQLLFNYDGVTPGCDFLFVCEGQREVMKLVQEGFPNAVALFGSNLLSRQLSLLASLAPKELVCFFDGDDAGYNAAYKVSRVTSEVMTTSEIETPHGCDPKNLSASDIHTLLDKRRKVEWAG